MIQARDLGDSRLTSYFYAFEGAQGDVFVNVVTKNYSGDIDIFTADTVQPVAKIVVYADSPQGETGRVFYLRRPTRLLLRIQGRTPNDEPATFRIKFAGSFVALAPGEKDEAPTVDRAERDERAGSRVNSVGTIIEVRPKPKDQPKAVDTDLDAAVIKPKDESAASDSKEESAPAQGAEKADDIPNNEPVKRTKPAPEVKTVFDNKSKKTAAAKTVPPREEKPSEAAAQADEKQAEKPLEETKPADPLASINLVILLKDGGVIERPMSEVLRFSVDKGVLTVITKDRKTSRFSILNVEKVTIQ